ncbi:hypothetical protein ABPG74_012632 [Tetrahymena malaccensis]
MQISLLSKILCLILCIASLTLARNTFEETSVVELDEQAFRQFTGIGSDDKKIKEDFIVFFYAHWCSYCRKDSPTWIDFKNKNSNENIMVFHCPDNQAFCEQLYVYSYPTILLFPKGTYQYCIFSGPRDQYEIQKFWSKKCENEQLYDIKA